MVSTLHILLIALLLLRCVIGQEVDIAFYTNPALFQSSILDAHNQFRSEHGVEPLIWSTELATFAQDYTKQCIYAHSHGPYGENLALHWPSTTVAVGEWGNEGDVYDFNKPGFSLATGHFAQLVWASTREVGCAAVECDSIWVQGEKSWLLTCEYSPRGNYMGEFEANVYPCGGRVGGAEKEVSEPTVSDGVLDWGSAGARIGQDALLIGAVVAVLGFGTLL